MFKKMVSFLALLSFMISSSFAGTHTDLKSVIDDFNYSMTVEWDQVDKEFQADQVRLLKDSLKDLKAQGLTNDEIMNFIVTHMADKKIGQDASALYEMVKLNTMSSSDALMVIQELMKESSLNGANFSGSTTLKYIGIGALAIVLMFSIAISNGSSIN
ncbi:MAG TPA: hypothetical protein VNJ08_10910 [Bacteriovoracaceae bacterium]|nr:hypothetical protein [Bacteriovoracaceae bacterium]